MHKLKITLIAFSFLMSSIGFSAEPKLDLKDLGFTQEQTKKDPELQLALESRSSKLKAHQITGILTGALMIAAVGLSRSHDRNNNHQFVGAAAGLSYWTTFYLAQTAPVPEGTKSQGWNIKIHKALQWVHGPLMILTPIAGVMANDANKHHKPKGTLASRKSAIAGLAAVTYLAGSLVMAFEF